MYVWKWEDKDFSLILVDTHFQFSCWKERSYYLLFHTWSCWSREVEWVVYQHTARKWKSWTPNQAIWLPVYVTAVSSRFYLCTCLYLCTFHLGFLAFRTLRTFKAEVEYASGKSVALNCSINFDIPPSVKIVRWEWRNYLRIEKTL